MENNEPLIAKKKMENAKAFKTLCQGCLTENSLHNMFQSNFNQQHTDMEIYGEMLLSCFSIQIGNDLLYEKNKYFMCTECILKLKDAFRFKLQVEYTQAALQEMSELQASKEEMQDNFNSECYDIEVDCGNWSESTNSCEVNINEPLECENGPKVKRSTSVKKQRKKNNVAGNADNSSINNKKKWAKLRKMGHLPYIPEDSELQCRICNEMFFYNLALKHHLNTHSQNFICEKCGKAFSKESSLQIHVLAKHESKIYTCPLCPRTYTSLHSFDFHKRSHKNRKLYRCPICFERFESYWHRLTHLQSNHEVAKQKYKCKECPREFNHNGSLLSHIRNSHLMERKHVCQECGFAFFDNQTLLNHMIVHTGERNFECEICHKRYGRKKTLTEHMKIHNNIKRFICSICDRAFTQKCTLKGHMQVHLKEKK